MDQPEMENASDKPVTESYSPDLEILTELVGYEFGLTGNESVFEMASTERPLLIPGCADIQAAKVQRVGYRGKFPQPAEWENLLAMLEPGQELLWIINKREAEGFSFHLALKGDGKPQSSSEQTGGLRSVFRSVMGQFTKRSFPESLAEDCSEESVIEMLQSILKDANGEVVVTSGQPSPSILEDSREFPETREDAGLDSSLNDMVEPFAEEARFSVVFTVGRASAEVANTRLAGMAEFRTLISPFLKVQRGRSESFSDADALGNQTGETSAMTQAEARNGISRIVQGLFGSNANLLAPPPADSPPLWAVDKLESMTGVDLRKIGKDCWKKLAGHKWIEKAPKSGEAHYLRQPVNLNAPISFQSTTTHMTTRTRTQTFQQGVVFNTTTSNAMLELVDQKLQDSIRSLKKAAGTGAFFMGAEIFSPKTELSLRIARSISGSLAGARTHIRPFQTAVHRGPGFADHLTKVCTLEEVYPSIAIQSRHIAAQFLPVPEADLPGLKTKRNVFYGKPNPTEQSPNVGSDSDMVWLGDLSHLTSGFKSRRLRWDGASRQSAGFPIPAVDLTSHLLIAGTTGSGKTQRAAVLLNSLPADRFQVIVIESAKRTYRHLLRRQGVTKRLFALGANGPSALRINPFFFEPGTSLKRHLSIFSDALADLLPVEALIGPKLREAIQHCYSRYEWDIETGRYRGKGEPVYPNMADLHIQVMAIAGALKYGPEMNSNYKGALLGRSQLFIDELYQDIFGWGGSQSLSELFGEDDIILEMDALPPSEAKMPSFVLSLLLERMRSWQQARKGAGGKPKRDLLIVIEEAHNLLEKGLEQPQSDREMGSGGFLLKQIVRLLQEGRESGMGIVVVDQSPSSLADAVIRNTNTKMILRITDSEEAERIGATLGLTKEECRDLHDLEDGEAVVKVKNAGKALKLSPAPIVPWEKAVWRCDGATKKAPDYYRAAQAIREIAELASDSSADMAVRIQRSISELYGAAGSNVDASRYFSQKLLAVLCEIQGKALTPTIKHSPSSSEMACRVAGLLGNEAASVLSNQLVHILKCSTWEESKENFSPVSLLLLPLVEEHLHSDPHWEVMEAAGDFHRHMRQALTLDDSNSQRKDSYGMLLLLTNASTERFEAINALHQLIKP